MINLSEERILDFLDGRLATPDEEELLHTLAVSPERRQVMREHMKLRELTSTIARQGRFTVPEDVTSQLFSRLEEAGFTPPATPESVLLRAPQAASMRYAGAAALGAGTVASAVSSGWRFGAISLLAASVMSFVLGAGAFYVFGSTLGLKTHSQEMAALQHSLQHHVTPGLASEFALAQNNANVPPQAAGNASDNITKRAGGNQSGTHGLSSVGMLSASASQPIGPIAEIKPMNDDANGTPEIGRNIPATTEHVSDDVASNESSLPLTYTSPRLQSYTLASGEARLLNGPAPILPSVIPTPFADERGTISVRGGVGEAPSSTSSNMSSLLEYRFGMTMWNYVMFRASMGRMASYERQAQVLPAGISKGAITTPESNTPTYTTMIGLETGVTLDPIGVPIDALVGFMVPGIGVGTSDYSTFYGRASLMAHFEPWQMLEVSAGFEGVWYTHYLSPAINRLESAYSLPASASPKGGTSETCGLIGPALEFGWHF